MIRNQPASLGALLALALLGGWVAGCSDSVDPGRRNLFPSGNLMPTTDIVNPQLSGQEASYNLLVSWKGHDEDGTLAGFEIAVDDTSDWTFTTSFDSQFVFESKECCVEDTTIPSGSDEEEIDSLAFGGHSLFVRAIDNDGAEDPTPDHITFTSTNVFPETEIVRGPSLVANDVTATTVVIEWIGVDPDGSVSFYKYRLDDKPWVTVDSDCTLVRFTNLTSSQNLNDGLGTHFFTVVSIDNAGAEERTLDPRKNTLQWESVPQITGSLRINSNVMGARTGVSSNEGQIFEETLVSFSWRGDASRYGGVIQCYQYAYDQQEVFSGCNIASTRFPPDGSEFKPPIGSHTLFVRAIDDAGQILNATFPFVVVPGPRSIPLDERRILYVDDYDEGTGSTTLGEHPSDPVEDAFWSDMLRGYPIAFFDCQESRDIPSVRIIGGASTIIWYVDAFRTQLLRSNSETNFRNPLSAYVNAGGNLILVGSGTTGSLVPDNTFVPEDVVQPGCPHEPRLVHSGFDLSLNWFPAFCDTGLSFVYDVLKVRRSFGELQLANFLREARRDSSTLASFPELPTLTLDLSTRPPIFEGAPPYFTQFGLEGCEQYEVRRLGLDPEGGIPLWTYVDFAGVEKKTCGLYAPSTGQRGHVLLLSVPVYFFKDHEVRQTIHTFLDLFGENCQGTGCK